MFLSLLLQAIVLVTISLAVDHVDAIDIKNRPRSTLRPTSPKPGLALVTVTPEQMNVTFYNILNPLPPVRPAGTVQQANLSRRDTGPSIWYTYWNTNTLCRDDYCSTIQDGPGYMVIQLNGEGYTIGGSAEAGVYRPSDSSPIWGAWITPRHFQSFRDGSWGVMTDVIDCALSQCPNSPISAFVQGYDDDAQIWSDATYIASVDWPHHT